MKLQGILTIILTLVIIETNAKIMKGDSLSATHKSIISIAALTAKGDLPSLKIAFNSGLDGGLTINEIKEELIHLSAYCGFPRSLNGINTFSAVLDDRKSKGITDRQGEQPSRVKEVGKYEAGKEVLQSLTGRVETGPRSGYAAFVPAIDTLLKEHLFNDIFTRGVLDYKQRELITVSALVTLGGVESQLRGHIGICLNLGISQKQLNELISIVGVMVGSDRAEEGRGVLKSATAQQSQMMIRIAEIEIEPAALEEYKVILKEEAAASVKLEPGVISIFPMYSKENPTSIRILEIYADRAAYEQHLKTPHFQKYKTGTASMVKSLKLVDMTAIDSATMPLLFKKLKED